MHVDPVYLLTSLHRLRVIRDRPKWISELKYLTHSTFFFVELWVGPLNPLDITDFIPTCFFTT